MAKEALLRLLMEWPSVIIRDQDLASKLPGEDQTRYDVVSRALRDKVLVRLKRGVYLISPPYQKYLPNAFEIAQTLYGPSYISFESALSHHGLIPEAVYTTTSACLKRSNSIKTTLGQFQYLHVPPEEFMLGVKRIQDAHAIYLMATPWKAIADLCYIQKKQWKNFSDMCEDLRIEKEDLQDKELETLHELTQRYGSTHVQKILSRLKP
jgi:predicted transcriptional regulator of viral defense system